MLGSHSTVWGMGEDSVFNGHLPEIRDGVVASIGSGSLENLSRTVRLQPSGWACLLHFLLLLKADVHAIHTVHFLALGSTIRAQCEVLNGAIELFYLPFLFAFTLQGRRLRSYSRGKNACQSPQTQECVFSSRH